MSEEDLTQRITNLENDMMLVKDGSIVEHISEAIHWLATTVTKTGGTDYTADGAWTDLSLKAWTSNKAKFVILLLHLLNTSSDIDQLGVRKNGDTPTGYPRIRAPVASRHYYDTVVCACDTNQVIEYYATDASDTEIIILGYIE